MLRITAHRMRITYPASSHSAKASHTYSGDTATAPHQIAVRPSNHPVASFRSSVRSLSRSPPPYHPRKITEMAIVHGSGTPSAVALTAPTPASTTVITAWPIRMDPTRFVHERVRLGMITFSPLVSIRDAAPRSPRPPDGVSEHREQRGDHHRAHHEGVDDHPDPDDEPDLSERHQRQQPEGGDHRGEHDAGARDPPAGRRDRLDHSLPGADD